MKDLLFLFMGILLFSNCDNNNSVNNQPGKQKISFSNLQVGQESRYIYLTADHYQNPDSTNFRYHTDTLIVQVIEKNDSRYRIKEFLSPNSEVFYGGVGPFWHDLVNTYKIEISNDTIHFLPDSNYFYSFIITDFFDKIITLPFIDLTDQYINIRGWKTDIQYDEDYHQGYALNYELFKLKYDRLNIIIDNRRMQDDWSGHTYVYSKKHGIVKMSEYSVFGGICYGWDLLGK